MGVHEPVVRNAASARERGHPARSRASVSQTVRAGCPRSRAFRVFRAPECGWEARAKSEAVPRVNVADCLSLSEPRMRRCSLRFICAKGAVLGTFAASNKCSLAFKLRGLFLCFQALLSFVPTVFVFFVRLCPLLSRGPQGLPPGISGAKRPATTECLRQHHKYRLSCAPTVVKHKMWIGRAG